MRRRGFLFLSRFLLMAGEDLLFAVVGEDTIAVNLRRFLI